MSPMNEKNWWGTRAKGPALPCGEVDEPAKAGGTDITSRASGFLVAEACTPRGVATHLGKHWLNEPSAITNNAGPQILTDPRPSAHDRASVPARRRVRQLAVAGPRAFAAAEQLV